MKTPSSNLNYLMKLTFYGFLFFIFHIITWKIFKSFLFSEFRTFVLQLILYCLVLLIFLNSKNKNYLIYIIPLLISSFLYFITVVTFTDRSLTVEMLLLQFENNENLNNELIYYEIDLDKYVEKRINEQINSGFIQIEDGIYKLTNKGKLASSVYKFFSNFYR